MKNDNLKLLSLIIVVLGIYLGLKGFSEYMNAYNNKRIDVIKKEVAFRAKRCFDKEDCVGEITIRDLRAKHYLQGDLINPISNEAINESTKIKFISNTVLIDWDF